MIVVGMLAAKGGEAAKSGPIGLAVILVLCVAVYFLFKSMSKHLRRVREEFPAEDSDQPVTAAGSASEAAGNSESDATAPAAPPRDPAAGPPDGPA